MRAEPDATPALVRGMAAFLKRPPAGSWPPEAVRTLLQQRRGIIKDLTGPKMQRVWSYLQSKSASVRELYLLEQWRRLNAGAKIPDDGATPADKACALLFYAAIIASSQDFPICRRSEVEKAIKPLRSAAEVCFRQSEFKSGDPDLAAAYRKAGEDLQRQCEAAENPFIVDRPGRDPAVRKPTVRKPKARKPGRDPKTRRDPSTRVRVVMLTEASGRLYCNANCGIVAEIASVALKDPSIERPTVTKWYQAYRRRRRKNKRAPLSAER